MKHRVWIPSAVFTLLLAVLALWASQQEPQPIFRVTSSEVVLEFIAIDKDGRFVTDLTADELTVKVDRKEVEIQRLLSPFTPIDAGIVTPGQLASGAAPSAVPSAGAAAGSVPRAPRNPPRTVILLDSRTLDSSNFNHSVRAIRGFIEESLEARHLVALAEIERDLKFLSPFTDDRAALLEALGRLQPETVYNPLDPRELRSGLGERYFQDLQQQVAYLRSGLRLLCHTLSGFPGRKHVVFFSEGYPLKPIKDLEILSRGGTAFASADTRQAASREVGSRQDTEVLPMVREVVGLANAFGISFYTVDARGLVAAQGFGDTSVRDQADVLPSEPGQPQTATGRGTVLPSGGLGANTSETVTVSAFQISNLNSVDEGQNALLALAAGTNGSAFFNSNDLQAVLHGSTRDQRYAYLVGFTPPDSKRPRFHDVKVQTTRKDVIIRSQVGFQDIDEQELTNVRLAVAFERPELFQHLKPVVQFQPGSGNKQVVVGVDGKQISGRRSGDQVQIEVVFVGQIYDEKGKPVSKKPDIVKGFKVSVSEDQFRSLAGQPLLAGEELKLKKGKYRLVLVVLDQISGTVGAVSEEFHVG